MHPPPARFEVFGLMNVKTVLVRLALCIVVYATTFTTLIPTTNFDPAPMQAQNGPIVVADQIC